METHNTQYTMNIMGGSEEQRLLAKWKPLLEANSPENDLPPITNKQTALVTARMLENQVNHMAQNQDQFGVLGNHQQLVSEAVGTAGLFNGYGANDPVFNDPNASIEDCKPCVGQYGNQAPCPNNDFYARGDSRLPNIIMPMIRRTFPELLANEIVGVQPMNGPVGLAFAMRFKYDGENLADFSPDGSSNLNPPASASHPHRSFGQEAGYQKLNTAHTGAVSDALTGLGDGPSSCFKYIADDQGVADLIKNLECSTQIPQMSMCIEKTAVEADVRKLAFKYSLEAEQDLMNMHSINLEDEMTNYMQYEMQAEIDREILMRMIQIALNNGEGAGYSIWTPANADGRWQAERAVALLQKIRVEAQRLCTRNRMGAANFAVVTPNVAALLQNTQFFKTYDSTANVDRGCGSARIGTIGNIKVFVDSRTEAQFQAGLRDEQLDYILLGYKGNSASETGLVYAPYIPIYVQKTTGPNDFSPRVGMATRYALVCNLFGAENFYHVIVMKGLFDCFTQDCVKFM